MQKRTDQTFIADPGSPHFASALEPGDVLLYARKGVFNWLINVKTWSRISHVEVVLSNPSTGVRIVSSRNGKGVHVTGPEWRGLALVMRSTMWPRIDKAMEWYDEQGIEGQGYDWLGLLNFAYARKVGRNNGKMFCSEFATRFLRKAGLPLFGEEDADTIAPRDFLLPALLRPVWRSQEEWTRYWQFRNNWNGGGK